MAVTRTAKGTASNKTSGSTLTLSAASLVAGDLLVVSLAYDDQTLNSVVVGSQTMTLQTAVLGAGVRTRLAWCVLAASGTQTITATWAANLVAKAMVASMFHSSLAGGVPNAGEETSNTGTGTAASTAASNPIVGGTDSVLVGVVGTEGPSGDTAGTWATPSTNGQRVGTTGNPANGNVTVSEAYQIAPSAGSTPALSKTGMTSRDWGAELQGFYWAVPSANLNRTSSDTTSVSESVGRQYTRNRTVSDSVSTAALTTFPPTSLTDLVNASGNLSAIDESVESPDGAHVGPRTLLSWQATIGFSATGVLSGTQTVRIYTNKTGTGFAPATRFYVLVDGVQVFENDDPWGRPLALDGIYSTTFTPADIGTTDASRVSFILWIDWDGASGQWYLDAIEWNANLGTAVDSVSAVKGGVNRTASDTTGVSDSTAEHRAFFRGLSETTSISDLVTKSQPSTRSVNDTTALSESIGRVAGTSALLRDTLRLPGTLDFTDSFARVDATGWGNGWTTRAGSPTVDGSYGLLPPTAWVTRPGSGTDADVEVLIRCRITNLSATRLLSHRIRASEDGTNNGIGFSLSVSSGGTGSAQAVANGLSGSGTTVITGITAGALFWIRARVSGSRPDVLIRAWLDGDAEPTAWSFRPVPNPPSSTNTGAYKINGASYEIDEISYALLDTPVTDAINAVKGGGAGAPWSFTVLAELHDTTNATSYTTPSFTYDANKLIIAAVAARATSFTGDPTISGTLGWQMVNSNTGNRYVAVFAALTGGSGASGGLTVDFSAMGNAPTGCHIVIIQVDGADVSAGIANAIVQSVAAKTTSATSGTISLPSPPASANAVFALLEHPDTDPITPDTVTPPWTELTDASFSAPTSDSNTIWRTGTTSPDVGQSWVTAASAWGVVVEFRKGAGGGGGATLSRTAGDTVSLSESAGRRVAGTQALIELLHLRDTFSRTVSDGTWGISDDGARYHLSGESTSPFSVGGGVGTIVASAAGGQAAGHYRYDQTAGEPSARYDGSSSLTNVGATMRFRANKVPVGANLDVTMMVRAVDTDNRLRVGVTITTASALKAHASAEVGGTAPAILSQALASPAFAINTWFWVEAQVYGVSPTTIDIRVWQDGNARPSAPSASVVYADATVLQGPGGGGIRTEVSGSTTNLPITVDFDDFEELPLEVAPVQLTGMGRLASDSVSSSESNARLLGARRATSETITVTATVARAVGAARSAADTVTVGESVTRVKASPRSAIDTATLSEQVTRQAGMARAPPAAVTTIESVDRSFGAKRDSSDAATTSETTSTIKTLARTVADATSTTESVAGAVGQGRSALDAAAREAMVPDAIVSQASFAGSIVSQVQALDGTLLVSTGSSAAIRLSFPTPVSALGAVRLAALLRAGAADVTAAVEYHENGTLVIGSGNVVISAGAAQWVSVDVPAALISDETGAQARISLSVAGAGIDVVLWSRLATEAVSTQGVFARAAAQTTAVSESVSDRAGPRRSVGDTVTASESVATHGVFARTAQDTLSTTESVQRVGHATRTTSDSAPVSATVARVLIAKRAPTETIATTESIATAGGVSRSASDATTTSESAARRSGPARSPSDTTAVTESTARATSSTRSVGDTVATTDAVAPSNTILRVVADTTAVTESAQRQATHPRPLADTTATSEAAVRRAGVARPVSDTTTASDAVARAKGGRRSTSDTTATSTLASRTTGAARQISDAVSGSDTIAIHGVFARGATDVTAVADQVGPEAVIARAATDTVVGADSVATQSVYFRRVDDTVALSEQPLVTGLSRRVADTVAAADAASRSLAANRSVDDAVDLTEAVSADSSGVRDIVDAVESDDSTATQLSASRSMGDSYPSTEMPSAAIARSGSFSVDAVVAGATGGAFTVDALVRSTRSATLPINATVVSPRAASISVDAVHQKTATGSVSADATVITGRTGGLSVDAVSLSPREASLSTDATVVRERSASLTIDAVVAAPTAHLPIDAVVLAERERGLPFDATVLRPVAGSISVDAQIASGRVGTFTIDAAISGVASGSISIDAAVTASGIGAISIDASVSVPHPAIAVELFAETISASLGVDKISSAVTAEGIIAEIEDPDEAPSGELEGDGIRSDLSM